MRVSYSKPIDYLYMHLMVLVLSCFVLKCNYLQDVDSFDDLFFNFVFGVNLKKCQSYFFQKSNGCLESCFLAGYTGWIYPSYKS